MACRYHADPDTLAVVDNRGTARNVHNRPCTSPPGIAGPRADNPETSMELTCNSLRLDLAPCVIPREQPSTRLSPVKISTVYRKNETAKNTGDAGNAKNNQDTLNGKNI